MDLKEIVGQLDQIANEIQSQEPVAALALDQISDEIEKTAGIMEKAKGMLGGLWDQVKGQIKKMTLENAINAIVDILKKDPQAIGQLQNLLEGGLKYRPATQKTALQLSPTIIAIILSALTIIGAAKAFDAIKEKVDENQKKQIVILEDLYKQLR